MSRRDYGGQPRVSTLGIGGIHSPFPPPRVETLGSSPLPLRGKMIGPQEDAVLRSLRLDKGMSSTMLADLRARFFDLLRQRKLLGRIDGEGFLLFQKGQLFLPESESAALRAAHTEGWSRR